MEGLLLTKKDICNELGLTSATGRSYSYKLRKLIFTDEFLKRLNLELPEYNRIKLFDLEQSRCIKQKIHGTPSRIPVSVQG